MTPTRHVAYCSEYTCCQQVLDHRRYTLMKQVVAISGFLGYCGDNKRDLSLSIANEAQDNLFNLVIGHVPLNKVLWQIP